MMPRSEQMYVHVVLWVHRESVPYNTLNVVQDNIFSCLHQKHSYKPTGRTLLQDNRSVLLLATHYTTSNTN